MATHINPKLFDKTPNEVIEIAPAKYSLFQLAILCIIGPVSGIVVYLALNFFNA